MKYMLLMNSNGKAWSDATGGLAGWNTDEIDRMMTFMGDLNTELKARGEWVDAQGLTGPEHAKLVQARDGQPPVITDGPFAESKELLAGYWVLDVRDEARILEIATHISTCPGPGGTPLNQTIEVRPVHDA